MKMAGGIAEGAGFWLPSEFLTDNDSPLDKENFSKSNNTESDSEFCFPTEFPYDFETQTDQLLEKFWVTSTSPQSTLAHFGSAGGSSNGSPNGAPSPPLGVKCDAVGDLIYLAAGQVAKLQLNRGHVDKTPFAPPRSHAQYYPEPKTPILSVYLNTHSQQKHQNGGCGMLYSGQQMYQNRGGKGHAAWTPHQNLSRGRAVFSGGTAGGGGGGAAAKRVCAGTGVFLPRRYENISNSSVYSSDFQRKPGRAAVQVQTNNFNNVNSIARSQPQPQPRINRGPFPDYDFLLARRNAVLLEQQRNLLASLAEGSSMMGRELYLPQEWTY